MASKINLRPVLNKKNGQINFSLPKKKLPKTLREVMKKDPNLVKSFKFELDFE